MRTVGGENWMLGVTCPERHGGSVRFEEWRERHGPGASCSVRTRARTHDRPKSRLAEQLTKPGGEIERIARIAHETGVSMDHVFLHGTGAARDYRKPAGLRFEDGATGRVCSPGEDEHISGGNREPDAVYAWPTFSPFGSRLLGSATKERPDGRPSGGRTLLSNEQR